MPKKSKPFVLTLKSYFDPKRPHISVSMINDYLRCPEFYHKKHVLKTIPRKPPSSPMKVGSFVDASLTNPAMARKYRVKVLAKDDRELYEEQKAMPEELLLTEAELLKGRQLVEFIKSQPFWTVGRQDAIMQFPLEAKVNGQLLCGLPDRMDWNADKTVLNIRDLKISSFLKTSSPAKWFWNAKEMGYLRQFAMYRLLACATYGIEKSQVCCSHMVGIWHEDGLVDVQLYRFPNKEIDKAEEEILWALNEIDKGNFDRKEIGWDSAVDLSYVAGIEEDSGDEEGEETL